MTPMGLITMGWGLVPDRRGWRGIDTAKASGEPEEVEGRDRRDVKEGNMMEPKQWDLLQPCHGTKALSSFIK